MQPFTVHYSTMLSVLPSSLLAFLSVLTPRSSFLSILSVFFFFSLVAVDETSLVVVHHQVSECFEVLQEGP